MLLLLKCNIWASSLDNWVGGVCNRAQAGPDQHLHPPRLTPVSALLQTPFYLVVETSGSVPDHDYAKLDGFLEAAYSQNLIEDGTIAQDSRQAAGIWQLRENISEALRLAGGCCTVGALETPGGDHPGGPHKQVGVGRWVLHSCGPKTSRGWAAWRPTQAG